MGGCYLGPRASDEEISSYLDEADANYQYLPDPEFYPHIAKISATENVVGWYQRRMEFGSRAFGGRLIMGDSRSAKMQSIMNLKITYREYFRPFAA